MEIEDVEAAKIQADELLNRETPYNCVGREVFSKTVRSVFENIRKARADGFSFVQICAAYEKVGLLPRGSRIHSFRQAFYREGRRKEKEKELSKRISDITEAEKKIKLSSPNPEGKKPERTETGQEDKKISGVKINTGTGTITKNTDGSFAYE